MPLGQLFVAIVLHYIKPHVNYYYYLENQYPLFTLKSSVKNSLSVLVSSLSIDIVFLAGNLEFLQIERVDRQAPEEL